MRVKVLVCVMSIVALPGCSWMNSKLHLRVDGSRHLRTGGALLERTDGASAERSKLGVAEAFWDYYCKASDDDRMLVHGLAKVADEMGLKPRREDRAKAKGVLEQDSSKHELLFFDGYRGAGSDVDRSSYWPKSVRDLAVSKKMVKLTMDALVLRDDPFKVTFHRDELEKFVLSTISWFGLAADSDAHAAFSYKAPQAAELFEAYLVAYYMGKFVTRDGVRLSRPAIKGQLGTDAASAFAAVLVEAMFDSLVKVPVFYYKKAGGGQRLIWLNSTDTKPTAAVFNERLTVNVAKPNGITKREAQAIQLFAAVAGSQSQHLAGVVFRSLGDMEVGVGLAAHLSVGDNDTLAKAIDGGVEAFVRRTVELKAYLLLRGDNEPPWLDGLLTAIEKLMDHAKSNTL